MMINKIKIGDTEYKIFNTIPTQRIAAGEINYTKGTITIIDKKTSRALGVRVKEEENFLHELVHGLFHEREKKSRGLNRILFRYLKNNEEIIREFTKDLLSLLKQMGLSIPKQ